ncbi:hypothetical protein [Edwardsiella tarda]|uniref:hypothetical protein n=1 Tax=Edwardsiella tarda TaxID=636 RepID=UPI003D2F47CD
MSSIRKIAIIGDDNFLYSGVFYLVNTCDSLIGKVELTGLSESEIEKTMTTFDLLIFSFDAGNKNMLSKNLLITKIIRENEKIRCCVLMSPPLKNISYNLSFYGVNCFSFSKERGLMEFQQWLVLLCEMECRRGEINSSMFTKSEARVIKDIFLKRTVDWSAKKRSRSVKTEYATRLSISKKMGYKKISYFYYDVYKLTTEEQMQFALL